MGWLGINSISHNNMQANTVLTVLGRKTHYNLELLGTYLGESYCSESNWCLFFFFSFSGEDCFGTFPCINHGFKCQSKLQYLSILCFHDNRYNNDTRFGIVVEFLALKREKYIWSSKTLIIYFVYWVGVLLLY